MAHDEFAGMTGLVEITEHLAAIHGDAAQDAADSAEENGFSLYPDNERLAWHEAIGQLKGWHYNGGQW